MKNTHPVITLLGNNSGRNLGDAAIMSGIFDSLSRQLPDVEFLVPSIAPSFIDHNYSGKFNAKGIDARLRTFSLRLLGIPTIQALKRSDVALICDGIIFGYKLFNPHNFLITLIFIVPLAKLFKCKVVCFSCGIGPFPTKLSEVFARWVINLCDLVIMRENDSKKLAEMIGVTRPIQVTGDAAFLNYVSSEERAHEIARVEGIDLTRPLLGLNVTHYLDSWLRKSERLSSPEDYLKLLSDSVLEAKKIIREATSEEPQCVVFSCSPLDEDFSFKFAELVNGRVIDNSRYLSHDIQALMKQCNLFMGMRFHSLVLSSSVGVPIVGLVYAPKVKGYLRYLECEEYCVELNTIAPNILGPVLAKAWIGRVALREKQQQVVRSISLGAKQASVQLVEQFFPKRFATSPN